MTSAAITETKPKITTEETKFAFVTETPEVISTIPTTIKMPVSTDFRTTTIKELNPVLIVLPTTQETQQHEDIQEIIDSIKTNLISLSTQLPKGFEIKI